MKPMIEHFEEINKQLDKEESIIMDELEGALNQIASLEITLDNVDEYYRDRIELLEKEIEKAQECVNQYHVKLIEAEQANDILSQALYAVSPQAHKLIMLEIENQRKGS